jgi:hypothetical protein
MDIKIDLPGIADQQRFIYIQSTEAAIAQLQQNLLAPTLPGQTEIDERVYSNKHLLTEDQGYEPPHPDVVGAYFRHFQKHFPEYGTDAKLAKLLGLSGDRRVRAFKDGSKTVPYGVWRKFLVITGRAPQDIIHVFGFMG